MKAAFRSLIHSIEKQIIKVRGVFFKLHYTKVIRRIRSESSGSENLDMIFPDHRADYDSKIDKIKHIATKILLMIDHLGTKNNFEYMLSYGSLLGAIRHKGFIPWDDDLDIMMTKKDLNKLIEVCNHFPESILLYPVRNNFVKVMDLYSKISFDGKRGVAIDIFVLDDEDEGYSFVNVHNLKRLYLSKSDIFPLRNQQFENHAFPIPASSEKILTMIYGNYMKLPPEEERVYSHLNNASVHILDYPKTV